MAIWTKAEKAGGQDHVVPSNQNSTPGWLPSQGSSSGGPEAKLERAKSTQLNFLLPNRLPLRINYGVDASFGLVV